MRFLIDLIFPKICFGCGKSGSYLCKDCLKKKCEVNFTQECHVCSKECRVGFVHKDCSENSFLDGLIFVSALNSLIKEVIHSGKYNGNFSIFEDLGIIMGKYLSFYNLKDFDCVTFVPVHNFKERQRGFNHAKIMAQEIAKINKTIVFELLIKEKASVSQASLKREERSYNLKASISQRNGFGDINNVLIIDDIYTTGATLNECAKVLKMGGVKKVIGFVFAKAGE